MFDERMTAFRKFGNRLSEREMKRNVPSFGSGWKKQTSKRVKATPSVPRQIRVASKLNKQELKAFDTSLAFTFDATGEVPATGQLSLVQTGDTLNNRDGAVIQVKSLQIRGYANFTPGATATAASTAYLYVVLDRQANGAAAAVTDVLTSTDMSTALGNVPNQYRFKILKRIVIPMVATAGVTTAYNPVVVPVEEYIKFLKPIEMRFKASAGAITDLSSNNIFLLAGTEGTSDDLIGFAGTARLRFTG